ncbi:glycosyltransferase family 2 protein [Paenibacillus sp. HW567]|uniref:glycosyltransferase family 2 protein n=1 Tax=Paenibacillus sp. HW567 TaxID=1034769 RepID=UPI00037F98AA|nr:glycosyltransferase family 2 protein [Paenibacillus sp. HW567]
MEDTVTILMATYNGEKYLKDQLESILNQSYKQWYLIIRDDCSKDSTPHILKEYSEKDSRIKYILGNENLGPVLNFNELIKEVLNSKYIMFADQDDVWFNYKIDLSIKKIKEIEAYEKSTTPILLYTRLKYVNENLSPLNIANSNPKSKNLNTLLSFNYIWGCTIITNQALIKEAYPIVKKAQNHDYWLALHAAFLGVIHYVDQETILYRQHSTNVTGGLANRNFKSKVKRINRQFLSYEKQIKQNLAFCEKYKERNNLTLIEYERIIQSNSLFRLYRAYRFKMKKNSILETMMFYIFLLSKNLKENSKID